MDIQLIEENNVFQSSGKTVYRDGKAVINISGMLLGALQCNLLQRLTRERIHQVLREQDRLIVVTKGNIGVFSLNGEESLANFSIDRGSRPLRQGVDCVGNAIYYGDYWGNPERMPVNLYRIDLVTFEKTVISVFEHIRHVHCVHRDTRDERYLFVGTGDTDTESGIYRVDSFSGAVETIAEGAQCFRAVSLIQKNNILLWGSDSPDRQNAIYRLDLASEGLVEKMLEIEGPAYYSTRTADDSMYISTAVEDKNLHKAVIYQSVDSGLNWKEYRTFKKDMWPEKWFGYGVVEFPRGHEYMKGLRYNLYGLKEI